MKEEKIGVIKSVKIGYMGYQEAEFGLELNIDFKGSGVFATISGGWASGPDERSKWTIEDHKTSMYKLNMKIIELLKKAKVDSIEKLKGKPVRCVFDINRLESWDILEEAIL